MEELSLAELDGASVDYDRHALASPDIDHFCSSSDWVVPAALGLMPARAPWIRKGAHGYVALMATDHELGPMLEPLEAMWGLGCPLVGADPEPLAQELAGECARADPRRIVVLCGLERASDRFRAAARALGPRHDLRLGPVTRRFAADLRDGLDGFLARRSPKLRANLRRARRRAAAEGITFAACPVGPGDADEAYARLLAIDGGSWKGRAGAGIADGDLLEFYRLMLRRLAARGAARLLFASRDGEDLAFILGGVLGDTYRGLQFSFAAGHEASSLGNLCQLEQIAALTAEGVGFYDLGAEVEYKRRWGELTRDTVTLIAFPRA